jgi:hypothetical protein
MSKLERLEGGLAAFYCPGCKCSHGLDSRWTISGTEDAPTIMPSVMHEGRCHLFVRDGMIQYLSDCTHKLAGKTVPMEDI